MRAECIQAVFSEIGRTLTVPEAKGVEELIGKWKRRLAADDPQGWAGMSESQRLQAAAERAGAELQQEAIRKKVVVAKTINANNRIHTYLATHPKSHQVIMNLSRLVAPLLDGMDHSLSVDSLAKAKAYGAIRTLTQDMEKLGPKMLGMMQSREGMTAILKELRGEASGVPEAVTFAKEFSRHAENFRKQFNAEGGNIGRLENWFHPQNHNQFLIIEAGRKNWVKYTVDQAIDQSKYVHDDGTMFTPDDLYELFDKIFDTITQGGMNKVEPGRFAGTGALINRHSAERAIHYKDANAFLDYQAKFGKNDMLMMFVNHLDGMAHDVAMVQIFGPNPKTQFKYWMDYAEKLERNKVGELSGKKATKMEREVNKATSRTQKLFDWVAGDQPPIVDVRLARVFDNIRNVIVAGKLGSSAFTSMSDEAYMAMVSHANNIGYAKVLKNELSLMADGDMRRHARRMGFGIETMISSINRYGQEHYFSGLTQRYATFSVRAGGLNFLTDVRKQAFGITMSDAIGHLTRKHASLASMDKGDHRMLLSKGITEQDWSVWKAAKLDEFEGNTILTADAILSIPDDALIGLKGTPERIRQDAADKFLATILDETDVAVLTPGSRERAFMYGGSDRGTWSGEIVRSMLLFKSFPVAAWMRHIGNNRGGLEKGGTAVYLAKLAVTTSIMGALSLELNALSRGQDPLNLNPFKGEHGAKNWVAALLKGGALGVYGDLLFSTETSYGHDALTTLAGPVFGEAKTVFNLTQGNLARMALGEKTNATGDAIRFAKGLTPLGSWGWGKAGFDHLMFQQLQDAANPGYTQRMKSRLEKNYGTKFYYPPGQKLPTRAPDFSRIIGE